MKAQKYFTLLLTSLSLFYIIHPYGRPTGGSGRATGSSASTRTASSSGHSENTKKLAGVSAMSGQGQSKDGAALGAAGLASSKQNQDDSGGDSSGGSTPTDPSTQSTAQSSPQGAGPTTPEAIPVYNNDVPISTNNQNQSTNPADSTQTSPSDQTSQNDQDRKDNDDQKNQTTNEDKKIKEIPDQENILETLQILSNHDNKIHALLSNDSMNQLFNNFVHFKNFIVSNFKKDEMLELCAEFINQIYPQEHVKTLKITSGYNDSNEEQSEESAPEISQQDQTSENLPQIDEQQNQIYDTTQQASAYPSPQESDQNDMQQDQEQPSSDFDNQEN